MNPIDEKKETVTFSAKSRNEEGRKRLEKIQVHSHNIEKLKHIEKKLIDKGIQRQDRHPVDGQPLTRIPKSGHGGKYTWEGPHNYDEGDMEPVPDENDPNYADEEAEEMIVSGVEGMVVGEVEVAKLAEEGVARVDVVEPKLQAN